MLGKAERSGIMSRGRAHYMGREGRERSSRRWHSEHNQKPRRAPTCKHKTHLQLRQANRSQTQPANSISRITSLAPPPAPRRQHDPAYICLSIALQLLLPLRPPPTRSRHQSKIKTQNYHRGTGGDGGSPHSSGWKERWRWGKVQRNAEWPHCWIDVMHARNTAAFPPGAELRGGH